MILLLATALLLQDPPAAADLLKQLEEKYAAAKSFSVTLEAKRTGRVGGGVVDDLWKGSFISKGDGMVRMEMLGSLDGRTMTQTVWTSDGKNTSYAVDKMSPQKKAHTMALGTWSRRYFSRVGITGVMGSLYASIIKPKVVLLKDQYRIGGVEDDGTDTVGEAECRIVKCTLAATERGVPPMECRLWIDAKNLVLLKRESVKKTAIESVTMTETFVDSKFDGEIEDSKFKVP